jgi:hypothetical protein
MEIDSADIIAAGLKIFGKWGVMVCEGQYLCAENDDKTRDRLAIYVKHLKEFGCSNVLFEDRYFLFETEVEAAKFYEFFNQLGITYSEEYAILFNDQGVTVDENT